MQTKSFRIIVPPTAPREPHGRPCVECKTPFRKRTTDVQRPYCVGCSPYAKQVAQRVARGGIR